MSVCPRDRRVGAVPGQVPGMGPPSSFVKERSNLREAAVMAVVTSVEGKDAFLCVGSQCHKAVDEAITGQVNVGKGAVK